MSFQKGCPSDENLLASIEERLSSTAEESFVDHLCNCQTCQSRLENLAIGSARRGRVQVVLQREAEAARSSLAGEADHPLGVGSIEDFAVTFLQPTDRQGALGRLGEFEVMSVIGRGGMGVVMRGFQKELNRPVAIKIMSPHLATIATARKRFLREAQATAAIVHPNVMPILSVSDRMSLPFLVMPFVACHSLQQRIDAEGPLPVEETLRVAIQVASGLAAAHRQGLVHRDVKPANILLERGVDRAMLTDFGLARAADDVAITRSGVIAGTPQYMSPEQARGEGIDARSDLFSVGSVIYAMLTGIPPFRAETTYGIMRKITDETPVSLRDAGAMAPSWLEQLVVRLLSKDKNDRPQDAEELVGWLEACLAHHQQPDVHRIPMSLKSTKPTEPMMKRFLKYALLLFLTLVVVSVSWWGASRQRNSDANPASPGTLFGEPSGVDEPLQEFERDLQQLQAKVKALDREFDSLTDE